MSYSKKTKEVTPRKLPDPIKVYYETAIHPETGKEYQYKVTVYPPSPNPNEFLNPAYAFGSK